MPAWTRLMETEMRDQTSQDATTESGDLGSSAQLILLKLEEMNQKIDRKISDTEDDIKAMSESVSALSSKVSIFSTFSESVTDLNSKFDKFGVENEIHRKSVSDDINNIREVILNNLVESNKNLQGCVSSLENRIDTLERTSNINSQRQREITLKYRE